MARNWRIGSTKPKENLSLCRFIARGNKRFEVSSFYFFFLFHISHRSQGILRVDQIGVRTLPSRKWPANNSPSTDQPLQPSLLGLSLRLCSPQNELANVRWHLLYYYYWINPIWTKAFFFSFFCLHMTFLGLARVGYRRRVSCSGCWCVQHAQENLDPPHPRTDHLIHNNFIP